MSFEYFVLILTNFFIFVLGHSTEIKLSVTPLNPNNTVVHFANVGYLIPSVSYMEAKFHIPIEKILGLLTTSLETLEMVVAEISSRNSKLHNKWDSELQGEHGEKVLTDIREKIIDRVGELGSLLDEEQVDKLVGTVDLDDLGTTSSYLQFSKKDQFQYNEILSVRNSQQLEEAIGKMTLKAQSDFHVLSGVLIQLREKHLEKNILKKRSLSRLFYHLRSKAREEGYEALINHPAEMFQLNMTCKSVTDFYHISCNIRVPVAKMGEKVRLLQHLSTALSPKLNLAPINKEDEILAVWPDMKFQIVTQTELDSCPKLGRFYLCSPRNVLMSDPGKLGCTGALFANTKSSVRKNCGFKVAEPEIIHQLGWGRYLISLQYSTTAKFVCENRAVMITLPVQESIVKIPNGCDLYLNEHILISRINTKSFRSIETFTLSWRIEDLIQGLTLEQLKAEIDLLESRNATEIDLVAFENQSSRQNYQYYYLIMISLSSMLMSLILVWNVKMKRANI